MSGAAPIVFRSVRALDPALSVDAVCDVVIEKGRISSIGPNAGNAAARAEGATVISGKGRVLTPAFVDIHVHFREPGHEYKEDIASGLAGAAAGGFAHVCAMPNTRPINDTRAVTELMVARSRDVGGVALHPIGAITRGLAGKELTEMAELRDAGAVAVSDDGVCVQSSAVMRRALEYAKNFAMPVIQHAEDHALTDGAQMNEGRVSAQLGLKGWPRIAEDIIVARDVLLAEYVRAPYHVAHMSTRGATRIVAEAKSRGLPVTCEVTPHHLTLTDSALMGYDTFCKVTPPLREAEDLEALQAAVADGTIDAIATDHAPHSPLEKDCEFDAAAPGMIGLELCISTLLGLVRDGRVPLERLVYALTAGPAKIVGIQPPSLREGAVAEVALLDLEQKWTVGERPLKSKSHNTPFLRRELTGRVLYTMAGGRPVFDVLGVES